MQYSSVLALKLSTINKARKPELQHGVQRIMSIKEEVLLTFRGSCIVIYSYYKSQRDALFLKFILIKNSTCFGQICSPSSGVSALYTQQYVFVMLVMLTVCQQTVNITSMTNTYCCVYNAETPDDGQ
jgi:hypothetical protein